MLRSIAGTFRQPSAVLRSGRSMLTSAGAPAPSPFEMPTEPRRRQHCDAATCVLFTVAVPPHGIHKVAAHGLLLRGDLAGRVAATPVPEIR